MEEWIAVLLHAIDEAGLGGFDLDTVGLSAPSGLAIADAAGPRVGGILVDGTVIVDAERRPWLASRYAPSIVPGRHGRHFSEVFQRLRDEELQWPWFDGSVAARRGDPYYADVRAGGTLAWAGAVLATEQGLAGNTAGVMASLEEKV